MGQHPAHYGFALVGRLACDQVVERAAQAINIGLGVGVFCAEGLFGGHIIHGPHDCPGAGKFRLWGDIAPCLDAG
jgi:hypothetical protein